VLGRIPFVNHLQVDSPTTERFAPQVLLTCTRSAPPSPAVPCAVHATAQTGVFKLKEELKSRERSATEQEAAAEAALAAARRDTADALQAASASKKTDACTDTAASESKGADAEAAAAAALETAQRELEATKEEVGGLSLLSVTRPRREPASLPRLCPSLLTPCSDPPAQARNGAVRVRIAGRGARGKVRAGRGGREEGGGIAPVFAGGV
jgi:hypothetical protein